MRFDKKLVLAAVILISASTYLTLYTWRAHAIAQRIMEDSNGNAIAWRTGPSGSLFPWPTAPGMGFILSKVNEVDAFIYKYLIKPLVLVGSSVLMWVVTGFSIFRVIKSEDIKKGIVRGGNLS